MENSSDERWNINMWWMRVVQEGKKNAKIGKERKIGIGGVKASKSRQE